MKRLEDRKHRRRIHRLYKTAQGWNKRAGAGLFESAREYNKAFRIVLGF